MPVANFHLRRTMSKRVLLVEPYPDLSRVMTEMLVQVGYITFLCAQKNPASKSVF
jgi:hypothetical protein